MAVYYIIYKVGKQKILYSSSVKSNVKEQIKAIDKNPKATLLHGIRSNKKAVMIYLN